MAQNLKRMFFAPDRAMLEAHREDRDEDAEDTARVLLGYPELPLLIRARACMVLDCSGVADDALDMAKEAVRIAELGMSLSENLTRSQRIYLQILVPFLARYKQRVPRELSKKASRRKIQANFFEEPNLRRPSKKAQRTMSRGAHRRKRII